MNIYLRWTSISYKEESSFSIFNLEISQKENNFARARLVVKALSSLPPTGTEGVLYEKDDEILFKGFLVGIPTKMEAYFSEIELIACPPDIKEKRESLQRAGRVPPYWDDLWVAAEKYNDFQEIQEVRTASLYCDRRTGELSWSDWFKGKHTFPLHQNFFRDSLCSKIKGSPLKSCVVNVHAHWIQSESGVSNLAPALRKAFPHFKISSYTKESLLSRWPSSGKRLGRSGLWVIKSDLKVIMPTASFYPRFSPSVPLVEEEGSSPKPYRMQRYWFKPTLLVGWQYQQKRKETLSLTLHHSVQNLFPGEGTCKVMDFTLQHINPPPHAYAWHPERFYREGSKVYYKNAVYRCKEQHSSSFTFEKDQKYWAFQSVFHTPLGNPARSSFFLTEMGYQAAEHAMERAKCELAKSSRALEVSFEGPWSALKDVTTDTSIIVTDPRLPGGEVHGKVVEYIFTAQGETGERLARITLLCPLGGKKSEESLLKPMPSYATEGYCEESYQAYENKIRQTSSGLRYFSYEQCVPPQRDRGPLVRGVEVINGPANQEAELQRHAFRTPASVKKAFSQKPTRLRIFFKDLRTKERMDHRIAVRMVSPWSAPCGVGMGRAE